MRAWLLRHRRACSPWLLLVLLPMGGCGDDPRAGAGRPADAGQCNDLPLLHGDPGVLVGTHWSSDRHHWGRVVTVYACADPGLHGTAHMSSSDSRIRARPAAVQLGTSPSGVYAFEVTVSRGASGALEVWIQGPADGFLGTVPGPRVDGDRDGWHFVPHS